MLFFLLSADELRALLRGLGYDLPPETIPRTIEYYLARTAHDSTLSSLVHAWVLARNHRELALEHFERALRSDIADIQGGTTAEGVHVGAMAGCVDLLQRCFAGLETRHDALWLNPHWPRQLGRLEFEVRYRHQALTVAVSGRVVRVAARPGPEGRCAWAAERSCATCAPARPSNSTRCPPSPALTEPAREQVPTTAARCRAAPAR
jgi:trehalose 6-phosphate phosphatase